MPPAHSFAWFYRADMWFWRHGRSYLKAFISNTVGKPCPTNPDCQNATFWEYSDVTLVLLSIAEMLGILCDSFENHSSRRGNCVTLARNSPACLWSNICVHSETGAPSKLLEGVRGRDLSVGVSQKLFRIAPIDRFGNTSDTSLCTSGISCCKWYIGLFTETRAR